MRYPILTYVIALVWLINGLYCKVLDGVPRHQQIVARIIGEAYARPFTVLIGLAEIVMAFWVVSRWRPQLNAWMQIGVVATMNLLEFILVPDLLLWGRWNALFAFCFILLVYYQEHLRKKRKLTA
ncbi:MAG: DoxX-like family protein [Bacteroidota bacterium]